MRIRTETEWTSIVDEFIDKTDAAKQQLLIEKTAILEADIYKRGEQFYKDNKELQSVLLRIKEEEKVFDFLPELISKMDVWNAIRKMNNERYRQVLVDLELKDLDPKVLAREMNVTVENLYNIRHRAVKQLIAVIREEEHYV